ncbi:membrane protease [endosymbiont DhMRE of Dentiscutata heterogama]|uniref:zinc metalloprotease HtpX n=1 Tax=endosymbiont DhMRE of Dentiscutata heterogama TaxID=1609546 RepID=UPI000629D4CA|nr:zinc metalloprotease HtpX [endosymbiont DhMRE of Dentiscutata heterogama]CFW92844.1 membrane protease [endosymbiont DhMRE of Dentiscutata heterogama]
MSWKWIFITLIIAIVAVVITSLFSYYLSKWLAKWAKNVKRIDDRRDLNPKLKEIVRIVREISRIYKMKMPEVGVYPSQEINAFATGPAGNTLIAFSSNLINTMSLSEIRGVVGHELSHLIHYDIARILVVQGIFDVLHFVLCVLIASWLFRPSEEEKKTGELNIVKFILKWIFFEILSAIMRLGGILLVLWYNRKRELAADKRGAEIVGIDDMLAALRKLLELENRSWIVDGIDLTEDENTKATGEPNSVSLLKFNPEKKKRGLLELFRTHPRLEERIERLEKLKKQRKLIGII